jgi:glycosyltransferase involved in cell wall biosynthesis
MTKKLSIITINFNNLEGLKRTIESVINQTWQEFEYIVIDGGSTDGSAAHLESQRENIDYWVSEPDKGIYNAMNKGIARATGEYLLFLNSGDELYDVGVLEKNNSTIHTEDFVYFDIFLVFVNETKIHQYSESLNFEGFMTGSLGHPTTFIKKDLFTKIGLYDESLKIVSDWKFFMIAILKYGSSSRKINRVLAKFYMDGISFNNEAEVQLERKKVLEEYFSEYLRLIELERFLKDIKKSRTIVFMQKLGLLKFIDKIKLGKQVF